jgi:iron(III) transport system ATP-binding protein
LNIPLQEAAPRGCAVALLRPHNLRIAARDTTLADHEIEWNGAIRNREFLGHLVRYRIDTGGQDLLVDEEHAVDEPLYALGTRVRLAVDGTQIRLLGRGPGNGPPRMATS